jgi:hypothetical protein
LPLAAATPTHHQALLAIQPIHFLQVHHDALSARHFAQSTITEAAPFRRQRMQ